VLQAVVGRPAIGVAQDVERAVARIEREEAAVLECLGVGLEWKVAASTAKSRAELSERRCEPSEVLESRAYATSTS
jgi:hypothetical protein